jgi:hypothetical protein
MPSWQRSRKSIIRVERLAGFEDSEGDVNEYAPRSTLGLSRLTRHRGDLRIPSELERRVWKAGNPIYATGSKPQDGQGFPVSLPMIIGDSASWGGKNRHIRSDRYSGPTALPRSREYRAGNICPTG